MRLGTQRLHAAQDGGRGAAAPGRTMMPAIGNGKLQDDSAAATGAEIGLISLLSLKLLLLAFFILLNALSEFEMLKVRAALESVTKAFDGRLNVEHNRAISGAADGSLDGTDLLLADTGQLFETMLPAIYQDRSDKLAFMALEVQAGTFFATGDARLQAGRGLLLGRLAARLREWEADGIDYGLSILIGHREGKAGAPVRVERAAVLAQRLAAEGVPARRLAVGTFKAFADKVRLEFTVRRPAEGARDEGGARP